MCTLHVRLNYKEEFRKPKGNTASQHTSQPTFSNFNTDLVVGVDPWGIDVPITVGHYEHIMDSWL